ncbi:hypothetical protein ANO11243_051560 [Dothideomycetidae sp. 11243]|nr:hypothetical protein ANO11243_051560 [fungal sp. No.11243]
MQEAVEAFDTRAEPAGVSTPQSEERQKPGEVVRPKLLIRSSSALSFQRLASRSRTSSPLTTPALVQSPSMFSQITDAPLPGNATNRPRMHQRSSSSWSSHRITSTIDRIRTNVTEQSRSRSRPQSLIIPSRTPPPVLQTGNELRLDDLEERSPSYKEENTASAALSAQWTSAWETGIPNTPATGLINNGTFRLGVLPSPGVESFLESQSPGLRTPAGGSPLRVGSLAIEPSSPRRPQTAPLSPSRASGTKNADRAFSGSRGPGQSGSDAAGTDDRDIKSGPTQELSNVGNPSIDVSRTETRQRSMPSEHSLGSPFGVEASELDDRLRMQASEMLPQSQSNPSQMGMNEAPGSTFTRASPRTDFTFHSATIARDVDDERHAGTTGLDQGFSPPPSAPTFREAARHWPSSDESPYIGRITQAQDERYSPKVIPRDDFVSTSPVAGPDRGYQVRSDYRNVVSDDDRAVSYGQTFPFTAQDESFYQYDRSQYAREGLAVQSGLPPLIVQSTSQSQEEHYPQNDFADLSPQEAALANREDLFQAAIDSRIHQARAQQSQWQSPRDADVSPSLPERQIGNNPGSPVEALNKSPSAVHFSSPETQTSGFTSLAPRTQMPRSVSSKDATELQGPGKCKLSKKDKRLSWNRPTSAIVAEEQPEKEKKKRWSGLGSLFGRSKSTAGKDVDVVKRNRLSKQGPMIIGAPGAASAPRRTSPDKVPTPPEFRHSMAPSGQATLVNDDMHPRSHTPISRRSSTYSSSMLGIGGSGWTDQSAQKSGERGEPTIPNIEPTRRLHSAWPASSKRLSFTDVPDAFQPVSSPRDQTRLSQAFGEAVPPASSPLNRSVAGYSPQTSNQHWSYAQQNPPFNSAMSSNPMENAEISRRTSSAISQGSVPSSQRLSMSGDPRSGSFNQPSANMPPPGWADYGGYYIPEQVRRSSVHTPHRQSSIDQRPGQQSRRTSFEPSMSNSAQQSRRSSVYTPMDAAILGTPQYAGNAEPPSYFSGHSQRASRELPSVFSERGHRPPSGSYGSPQPDANRYAPHDQRRRPEETPQNQQYSPNQVPLAAAHARSPTSPRAQEHDEWMRREYEKRQREILAQQPHDQDVGGGGSSGYDTELYSVTYRQPPTVSSPSRAQQAAHSRQESQEQMKSTSYPGQEWAPAGLADDNYEWE